MADGMILWEGPSRIDGKPIVVIGTGIASATKNRKAANMVQVNILARDVAPHVAVKTGDDRSVCGDCKNRRPTPDQDDNQEAPCYVLVFQGPLNVWKCYKRGGYPKATPSALVGLLVRLGTYGDPSAVPLAVWTAILWGVRGWTGYTHQWRSAPEYRGILMASVDTPEERSEAKAMGFRTFRTRLPHEPLQAGEISCPASSEAGHRTTCDRCLLCDGAAEGDTRRDEAIVRHGAANKVNAYDRMRSRLRVL